MPQDMSVSYPLFHILYSCTPEIYPIVTCLPPGIKNPGTLWIRCLAGPRADLYAVEKIKFFAPVWNRILVPRISSNITIEERQTFNKHKICKEVAFESRDRPSFVCRQGCLPQGYVLRAVCSCATRVSFVSKPSGIALPQR